MQERPDTSTTQKPNHDLQLSHHPAGASNLAGGHAGETLSEGLWRGRWAILIAALAGCLIGLMVAAVRLPLYRIQAAIEVRGPAPLTAANGSDPASRSATGKTFLETECRIVESRALVARALTRLGDAERGRLIYSARFSSQRQLNEQDIEKIRRHLTAKPSGQSGIMDIQFLSPDPAAGVAFLNWAAQELADLNVERAWHEAQRKRQWTDKELADLRQKWELSEQQWIEYARVSGLNETTRAPQDSPDQGADVGLAPVRQSSASVIANDSKLRQLRAQLADVQKQISEWQALYGSSAPNVAKLRADEASTESAIRQRSALLTRNNAAAQPRANGSSRQQLRLNPNLDPGSRAHSIAHLDALRADAEANRRLYESETKRLREADVAFESNIGVINVVDAANASFKPVTPGRILFGFLGGLTGLLVGVLFVALRDHFSQTFSEPGLLARYLSVGVLGFIPSDGLSHLPHAAEVGAPKLNLSFGTNPKLVEAYRTLRSSILLKSNYRSGPKRLLITSAVSGEGRTSIVGNLGAALASAQRRVLLIDGDLRNPGLHNVFGADNNQGLSELLSRQLSEDDRVASRDIILKTQIPDLYLLPAGQAGTRAPEILSSVQLPQLIKEFARAFDFVLIDSPPLLPYADARSLARAADAAILVVRARKTYRRSALLTRDAILQDGTPLLGTVLTDWNATAFASI